MNVNDNNIFVFLVLTYPEYSIINITDIKDSFGDYHITFNYVKYDINGNGQYYSKLIVVKKSVLLRKVRLEKFKQIMNDRL